MPRSDDWFALSDGWVAKRVHSGPLRDVYLTHVMADAVLPRHYKHLLKRIFVVSGQITVEVDDRVHVLRVGDTFTIPANVPHLCAGGAGDSLLTVVYEPPFMLP